MNQITRSEIISEIRLEPARITISLALESAVNALDTLEHLCETFPELEVLRLALERELTAFDPLTLELFA